MTVKNRHICNFVFSITLIFSMLLSTAAPAAAEIQKPAGTAAGNPYNYVFSGAVNNPSGSGTEISAAVLTENAYTTDTGQCGQNVNNGTLDLSYTSTLTDDLYTYKLTKTATNLKTNEVFVTTYDYGARVNPPYKLLNVYPASHGMIGQRLMTELRSDGKHFYEDPITGDQMFTFDSVHWSSFMANPEAYMKNPDGSWKYEGVYFGAADANGMCTDGGASCAFGRWREFDFTDAAIPVVQQYIATGRAVVEGHDIPTDLLPGALRMFNPYFDYRAVSAGGKSTIAYVSSDAGNGSPGTSTEGNPLTTYPYKYSIGTAIPISQSHMTPRPSTAKANVWLTYNNATGGGGGKYDNAYLYTSKEYPNVAVSQAGHTIPNENDLKLIVNMLLYILPKRTYSNSVSVDARDIAAPEQPSVSGMKRTGKTNLMFTVSAEDYATKFDFSLQATGVHKKSTKPAVTMNDVAIKSGTAWYIYSTDTNPNGTISYTTNCLGLPVAADGSALVEGSMNDVLSISIPATATYLHIAAVDKAGNVGEVTTVEIPRTEDLSIQKEWDDLEDRFGLRSTEIVFDAFPNNSETVSGSCTATADSGYACTINDLLSYDENGNEITYTVRERNMPSAYSSDGASVNLASETSTTIINELVKKDLEISKAWEGDLDNLYNTRPVQITFDVYYGETVYGSCSARVEDGWKCSVTDLAVYDKSGEPIVYTVKERNVPRAYTADEPTVTEAEQTSVSLTNTLITKDVVVSKIWDDMENAYGTRTASLQFDLYQNDVKKNSCTVSSDTSWKCVFSRLPVYDPIGLEQKYVIKEAEVPVGYSTKDVTVSGKDTVAAEVTNKLETKDITVIKNWTDSNDHDRKRPESIVLKLFKDSELFKTKEINAADNSLSTNVWSYVFESVPKYSETGDPTVYDVKEFPAE